MEIRHWLLGLLASVPAWCPAATLDRSTLTEVVNNVKVIEPATKKVITAQVKADFLAPEVLRTGPDSRAEMIAPDQTVTRVGQNTIFSFSRDSREVDLQKGSVLFQSPSGKGGGNIRTPAASAAVLGTTLIVCATKNGGFKVLLIEGSGRVTASDGTVRQLHGGQLVYALPGGKLSPVFEFRLREQVAASTLVSGFKNQLPSLPKILAAIKNQESDLAHGRAIDTGLLASGSPSIAYRVDVARDTLRKQNGGDPVPNQRFFKVASSDAVISVPDLELDRIFVPEDTDSLGFPGDSRPFVVSADGQTLEPSSNAAQFVAANILFDTPLVSLLPYATREAFRFLALQDIVLRQSLDLGTFTGSLQLWAGGTFRTPRDRPVTLRATAGSLNILAAGRAFSTSEPLPESFGQLRLDTPLRLIGFTAENLAGSLGLTAGRIELQGVHLGAPGPVAVVAKQDLTILPVIAGPTPQRLIFESSDTLTPFSVAFSGQSVDLAALRDLSIRGTAIVAPRILAQAGRNLTLTTVLLDDTVRSARAGTTRRQVSLQAQEIANLRTVDFVAGEVSLQARTLILESINFVQGSRVVLASENGRLAPRPNTGQPALPGYVNFISNVKYGGEPAQFSVITGPSISNVTGRGIIIRPRRN